MKKIFFVSLIAALVSGVAGAQSNGIEIKLVEKTWPTLVTCIYEQQGVVIKAGVIKDGRPEAGPLRLLTVREEKVNGVLKNVLISSLGVKLQKRGGLNVYQGTTSSDASLKVGTRSNQNVLTLPGGNILHNLVCKKNSSITASDQESFR